MDDAQRAQILSGAGYATGALGALAPRLTARLFGLQADSGETEASIRMMSFRNVALAAVMGLVADDDRLRKQFFGVAAVMFAADTAAAVLAAATHKVPARTAVMLGGTTAALGVIAAGGMRED